MSIGQDTQDTVTKVQNDSKKTWKMSSMNKDLPKRKGKREDTREKDLIKCSSGA